MVHNHCTLLFQDPTLWKEKNFILGDLTNHRPQICVIFWTLVWHTVWMVNPPSHGFRAVCLWSCCSMHPGASHAIWIPSTMRPSSHKRWSQLCRIFADQEMMQGKKTWKNKHIFFAGKKTLMQCKGEYQKRIGVSNSLLSTLWVQTMYQ